MWTYITKNLICQGLGTHQQNMEKQIRSKLHLFLFQNNADLIVLKSKKVKGALV